LTACTIEGCPNPTNSRGLCGTHYARWRRHGNPLGGTRKLVWDAAEEEIEWFLYCGASAYEITEALHVTAPTLARLCYKHGRYEWGALFQHETTLAA
jgi:hypothetical protein